MSQTYDHKPMLDDIDVDTPQAQFEMSHEEENGCLLMKVDSRKFTYLLYSSMKRVLMKNTYQRY